MLWGVLIAAILGAGLLFLAYEKTAIPGLNSDATAQQSTIYGSDKLVIARFGTARVDVPLSLVSINLRHAMLAAEDREFYNEPAVSATGTLRALITDVRGGDITQGGSTITQQYVKNAYLNPKRTLSRKLDEILIAVKLGQSTSKNTILDDYLNTIYFGRDVYGIEAASRAYFDVEPSQLSVPQSALLAAVVNAPSDLDPGLGSQAKAAAKLRWRYVINGMRKEHWITPTQAAKARFPSTQPISSATTGCNGNNGFICLAVRDDLKDLGLTEAAIDQGGYKILTTINPTVQQGAVAAIHTAEMAGKISPKTGKPEASLVSITPGTGAIDAMYAGPGCDRSKSTTCAIDTTGVTELFDHNLLNYGRPPGSSMKPYTLIAALQQGIPLSQIFSGPAETTVDGSVIHNAGDEVCSNPCTLQTALAESINTVFVPLAEQVGPSKVAAVAHAAGIPSTIDLGDTPEITLGNNDVPVVDQADGYATIAAGGKQASPFLISKVIGPDGNTLVSHKVTTTQAFSATVADEATEAMEQVLKCSPVEGTACGRELDDGARPAAGKTGTATNAADNNSDAWFDGFTPQLATAVWVGNDVHGSELSAGGAEIYGGEIPAEIWQQTMDAALINDPIEQFATSTETGSGTIEPTTPATSATSPSTSTSATTSTSSTATTPSSPTTSAATTSTAATTSASTVTTPTSGSSTPVPPPAGSTGPGHKR